MRVEYKLFPPFGLAFRDSLAKGHWTHNEVGKQMIWYNTGNSNEWNKAIEISLIILTILKLLKKRERFESFWLQNYSDPPDFRIGESQ